MGVAQRKFVYEPAWRIIADSQDITEKINKNLHSLSIRDGRGMESDGVELRITDHNNHIEWPKRNVILQVWIGYKGEKLYYRGKFVVDEVGHEGPLDMFVIPARGFDLLADSPDKMKVQITGFWHEPDTHLFLSDIIAAIAARNGLKSVIGPRYTKTKIPHIDQTEESDVHFVTRLAERYDAVFKINEKTLVFTEKGKAQTPSGGQLPTIKISRHETDRHSHRRKGRVEYTGVRTEYYELKKGIRDFVLYGGGPKIKKIKKTFPNRVEAHDAARSEWQNIQRDKETLELMLAHGHPGVFAENLITTSGWRYGIDRTWLVNDVNIDLHANHGISSRISLELPAEELGFD